MRHPDAHFALGANGKNEQTPKKYIHRNKL